MFSFCYIASVLSKMMLVLAFSDYDLFDIVGQHYIISLNSKSTSLLQVLLLERKACLD